MSDDKELRNPTMEEMEGCLFALGKVLAGAFQSQGLLMPDIFIAFRSNVHLATTYAVNDPKGMAEALAHVALTLKGEEGLPQYIKKSVRDDTH